MPPTEIAADVRVALDGPRGQSAHGHLHGAHNRLTFEVDDPGVFAGSGDAPAVVAVAEELARHGLQVRVVHAGRHLVTLGDVSAPWWQRRATGSRRIRVGSWRGAWTSLRSRAGDRRPVLPTAAAFPPATMLPVAPTLMFRRRPVTTTHDPHGTGSPRLALERAEMWPGERQPVYLLQDDTCTIGSDHACDFVLPDLADHQVSVVHDADDEYVLLDPTGRARVHGVPVTRQVLRSGSRIDLGPHTLAYYRDESSDHGRPYGGRVGGEVGRQRPQPPRRSTSDRPGSAD